MWKDIKEFPKHYQVNEKGQVRSKERVVRFGNNERKTESRILKQQMINSGYCVVNLSVHGKTYKRLVHRIVAEVFCSGKTKEKNVVNHIDENKKNNASDNLEWCTQEYNLLYSMKKNPCKIICLEKKELSGYSACDVIKKMRKNGYVINGEYPDRAISRCCRGKLKTYKGLHFAYMENYDKKMKEYLNEKEPKFVCKEWGKFFVNLKEVQSEFNKRGLTNSKDTSPLSHAIKNKKTYRGVFIEKTKFNS